MHLESIGNEKIIMFIITAATLLMSVTPVKASYKNIEDILENKKPTVDIVKSKIEDLRSFTKSKYCDIKDNAWYLNDLAKLTAFGSIKGFPDGTFRAESYVIYAEFIKMILVSLGHNDISNSQSDNYWYTPYMNEAEKEGVIGSVYEYSATSPATRIDMAKIACKALNIKAIISTKPVFSDMQSLDSSWVDTAFQEYIIRGFYNDGIRTFKPLTNVTRAEATTMVERILEYNDNPSTYKNQARQGIKLLFIK